MISIIIPTLNEAAGIVDLLRYTAALPGAHELIVVDGGSSDGTPELVRALEVPQLQLLTAPRGRASQMNAGAAAARGDTLLFLHADTRLPAQALPLVEAALRDPAVVGGAFAMRFDDPGMLFTLMAWSNNLRSRRAVTGDQALFCRASVFRQLGGYPPLALMEDLALSAALRRAGTLHLLRPPVLVSARRHRRHGPLRVLIHGWYLQIRWALGTGEEELQRRYGDVR